MSGFLVSLYCETNTHAGADESIGTIDLPIQRNMVTRHPEFQDSTVKGALKRHVASVDPVLAERAFGGAPRESDKPGLVAAGTAHVLLLPLPTGRDTFWWFTSPRSIAETAKLAGAVGVAPPPLVEVTGDGVAYEELAGFIVHDVLVDLAAHEPVRDLARYCVGLMPSADPFEYFRARLAAERPTLAVLDDEVFTLLCLAARVVQPRNQLGERKRSENLWWTEFLQSETVMLTKLSGPDDLVAEVGAVLDGHPVLQLGGSEGLGAGRLRASVLGPVVEGGRAA